MNKLVLGKCSICGGRVVIPSVWYSVVPPEPGCEKCGAVVAKSVITMERSG